MSRKLTPETDQKGRDEKRLRKEMAVWPVSTVPTHIEEAREMTTYAPDTAELGQVRILPIDCIKPSPKNNKLYRPIDPTDSEIQALAESIREHGVKEPLVVSRDYFILSGHRRFAAS